MKKYENLELELMTIVDVIRTSGETGGDSGYNPGDNETDVDWD